MYRAAVHSVLVTPIGLGVPGNGLSQRCGVWADALAGISKLTRVVVPVVGPVDDDPTVLAAVRSIERSPLVPRLAQGVTRELGLTMGNHVHRHIGAVDVVVGVRSYMGDMCLGLQAATGARLVIDLDDDDVAFFTAAGHVDEAERFGHLIARVSQCADSMVSADGFGETHKVPNGVVVPANVDRARTSESAPRILFLGNMGYQPNRDAADWIIDEIAPEILRRRSDAVISIAGPGSDDLRAFGRGYVDDLETLMMETDVLIVPLREGSGTRIKILDAWAHGVPIVTTGVGIQGLDAVDGTHLLVADDAAAITGAVVRLLDEPELADEIATAGRQLVADRYSRDQAIEVAQSIVERVMSESGASDPQHQIVARAIDSIHTFETDEGLIVLDTTTGSVHELDPTASVIFSLIDGQLTDREIANEIRAIYDLDETPLDAVTSAVCDLVLTGLVLRVRRDNQGLRTK